MTQKKEPFYLTTAIAYTSGRPHIGNTYEIILSDAIARFEKEHKDMMYSFRQVQMSMV